MNRTGFITSGAMTIALMSAGIQPSFACGPSHGSNGNRDTQLYASVGATTVVTFAAITRSGQYYKSSLIVTINTQQGVLTITIPFRVRIGFQGIISRNETLTINGKKQSYTQAVTYTVTSSTVTAKLTHPYQGTVTAGLPAASYAPYHTSTPSTGIRF